MFRKRKRLIVVVRPDDSLNDVQKQHLARIVRSSFDKARLEDAMVLVADSKVQLEFYEVDA